MTYLSALIETTKPRIVLMVLVTTFVGFYLGDTHPSLLLFWAIVGTGLVCASCNALNQWMERDVDAKMRRTQSRPLPSGRLQPKTVLGFGIALGCAGLGVLTWHVNILTALIGFLSLAAYLCVYTPSKKVTPLCTLIGAGPGAAPVLMGWTAARGQITSEGLVLFAILFLWQLPHFFAIATMHKDDYARAGMPMMPVRNQHEAAGQAMLYSVALLLVSLLPSAMGIAGSLYGIGASVIGLVFCALSVLLLTRGTAWARTVFLASVAYLPLLLALLIVDKA